MITHRSRFAKFPLIIKWNFKTKNWYLFPQGWAWVGGFAEVSYVRGDGDFDVWEETHYPVYKGYAFSWLFIHNLQTIPVIRQMTVHSVLC